MKLLATAQNLLFPPQCALCREVIEQAGAICGECWQRLNFISHPFCRHCGYPHEFDMGEAADCAACMANKPEYHQHRSVLYFDEASKKLVHDLKYYDNPLMAASFAQWMQPLLQEWQREDMLIAPVPIHWRRLWKRKYNQAALIARALSRQIAVPVTYDLLKRTKHRPPQASLTRQQRLKNLNAAFQVSERYRDGIKSRPILLVDDVMTTGATLNACAKALKKAGAGRVYAVTLARTVLD